MSWNLPAGHKSHVSFRGLAAMEPGKHGFSSAEPIGQYVPLGHTTQSASLVIVVSVEFIRVPPGHGSGAAAPSAQ